MKRILAFAAPLIVLAATIAAAVALEAQSAPRLIHRPGQIHHAPTTVQAMAQADKPWNFTREMGDP